MSNRTRLVAVLLAALLVLGVLLAAVLPRGGEDGDESGDETSAQSADLSGIPDVVAVVNDEDITRDEFVAIYEPQFEQTAGQAEMSGEPVDQDQLKQETLDLLIDNRLLVQEAESRGLSATDEEIDELLTTYATNSGVESPEEYLAQLEEQQDLSADEVREQIADGVTVQSLVDDEIGDAPASEEELRELYDQAVAAQGEGAELPPFEEVREQLEEQVRSQKQQETYQSLVDAAREDADIETHL
ncbi:SurA N-terminal domain-containing protein [Aeromicrobium sp. YIM 150415]|uniref:SurA N-terminal domain-containing protein n=1 Tax=Aeromicrobium sp. YIM 150415 TaxID=2803912 RepID=UPI0019631946|nr:SurA N-terminal domain-containing protein [Aeromicrobium sp. YIM 150415]MBM9464542.1 SurA N-terminal domain-containing protein [Aeromicrobium sp. YIM 150415]